ncbi:MAG: HIT family protein [Deltaproteobacteria bacterium]|nr:HIT family protein [Deltaproteobacteria bacterium]
MATPKPCIFCRIIAGDAPCDLVHEDELTVAFMDLFPVREGHLLVVPKRHCENIFEADEASLLAVMANSRRLAQALKAAIAPDGIGVHQLNGAAAGQTVFHYHMHLIPRNQGDPPVLHGRVEGEPEALKTMATRIRTALDDIA